MDLKFTFGGASPDQHDHGGAPSGIPLPFAGTATPQISTSSELDVFVRLETPPGAAVAAAEVVTGDGVTYTRSEVELKTATGVGGPLPVGEHAPAHVAPTDVDALMRAVRSAISRAVAALEGPLASAITSIRLEFEGASAVVQALGAGSGDAGGAVTEELQARLGVSAGTPIRVS